MGREALATATDGFVRKDPLTHRESLVILEQLYDLVLDIEQRRRDQPPPEEIEAFEEWWVQAKRVTGTWVNDYASGLSTAKLA